MKSASLSERSNGLFPVAAAVLFAGSYTQWPLYSSNQNTYFLRGLAQAGYGFLDRDWLAGRADSAPVFSAFVAQVQSFGAQWLFYVVHAALAAAYFLALYQIAAAVFPRLRSALSSSFFLLFITIIHSSWLWGGEWSVQRFYDSNLFVAAKFSATLLTTGVADQYILGPYLQPSAFGVLILASVALFLLKREVAAVMLACAAAAAHPTYLLHAAILTAAYVVILSREGASSRAVFIGAIACICAVPMITFIVASFGPSDPATAAAAQAILVNDRIPHHARVLSWLSWPAGMQLAIFLLGAWLARHALRLRALLILSFGAAAVLTVIQAVSQNLSLALLFPWRISVWLVPVAGALIMARVAMGFEGCTDRLFRGTARSLSGGVAWIIAVLVAAMLSIAGINYSRDLAHDRALRENASIIPFVRSRATETQRYLIPTDLENFRLETGVPVYVDWKSHPYRDADVIEWFRRVGAAQRFYSSQNTSEAQAALDLLINSEGITHVVVPSSAPHLAALRNLMPVAADQTLTVLQVRAAD